MTEFAPYQGGAFQPPPAYSGHARSLRVPAWIAMIALGLIGTEALMGAALQAFRYPVMAGNTDPTAARGAVDDYLYAAERGIAVVLLLFAGVSFIRWLHQARTNLDGPSGRTLTWTQGWSVGGWLLPLGNLVIPQLVVAEIDRVSEQRADEAEGRPHERHRGVVVAWVVLWSLFVVVSQLGPAALVALDPGPAVLLASAFGIFEAVAAGSAILLVRQVTANQERARNALVQLHNFPTGYAAPAPAFAGAPTPAFDGVPAQVPVRPAAPDPAPASTAGQAPASTARPEPMPATDFPAAPDLPGASEPGTAAR